MAYTITKPATGVWTFDPAHTSIGFTVKHLMAAKVRGSFKSFSGTISQGDAAPSTSVTVSIDPSSIDTGAEDRDNHLRSADFFDAENHPVMTFKGSTFEKVSETKYKLTGDLTMRGNTKPVVLDVAYRGKITDPRGNTRIGLKGTTTIDRFEFGTVWDKMIEEGGLIVGREVEVTIKLELVHAVPEKKG